MNENSRSFTKSFKASSVVSVSEYGFKKEICGSACRSVQEDAGRFKMAVSHKPTLLRIKTFFHEFKSITIHVKIITEVFLVVFLVLTSVP